MGILICVCIICFAVCLGKNKKCKQLQKNVDTLSEKNKELQQNINNLSSKNAYLEKNAHPTYTQIEQLESKIKQLRDTCNTINTDVVSKNNTIIALESKIAKLKCEIDDKTKMVASLNTEIDANSCGLYTPTFEFAHSSLYKVELTSLREKQKEHIANHTAAVGSTSWTINGSESQGHTMVNNIIKLLLRAFNAVCDDIIKNITIANSEKSINAIRKNASDISKLGKIMNIQITEEYIDLKVKEAQMALDFKQKKQEEKELQKELKAQEKERQAVQKEIEAAQKSLQKEQSHYENVLKSLEEQIAKNGDNQDLIEKKEQTESKIQEIKVAIDTVNHRDANNKAGYVYVISNIGAFGENVFKIGMTRRLDPQERVDELGDASVPFNFDVHAMIFSEDAPGLEAALHKAFEDKKVNKINGRKEFFNVTLEEIKEEVRKNFDKTVEWNDVASAEQYRQSMLL